MQSISQIAILRLRTGKNALREGAAIESKHWVNSPNQALSKSSKTLWNVWNMHWPTYDVHNELKKKKAWSLGAVQ